MHKSMGFILQLELCITTIHKSFALLMLLETPKRKKQGLDSIFPYKHLEKTRSPIEVYDNFTGVGAVLRLLSRVDYKSHVLTKHT